MSTTDRRGLPTWVAAPLLVTALAPTGVAVALAARGLTADAATIAPTSAPFLHFQPMLADRATAAFDAADPGLVLVTTFLLLIAALAPSRRVPSAARWVLTVLAAVTTTVSLASCAACVWTLTRDPTPLESPASGYLVVGTPAEDVGRVLSGASWSVAVLVGAVTLLVLLRSLRSGGLRSPDGRTVGG